MARKWPVGTGDTSEAELADGELSDATIELPTTEYAVPLKIVVFEPSTETATENDGDDEYEQIDSYQSESSDREEDFNSSNDSGSDYEWVS